MTLYGALCGENWRVEMKVDDSEFYRSSFSFFMARRSARPAARALSSPLAICLASPTTPRAALAAFSFTLGLEASFCAA